MSLYIRRSSFYHSEDAAYHLEHYCICDAIIMFPLLALALIIRLDTLVIFYGK